MKFMIPFIAWLFSLSVFSQSGKQKEMLLVSTVYYGQKCEHVAFRVTPKKIEIDNCYNSETNEFKTSKTIDVQSERVIQVIYKMSIQDLKYYQKQIEAVKDCDTIKPIKIRVNEKGITTEIEWNGITNCYPQSVRKVVESLELLFIKYK